MTRRSVWAALCAATITVAAAPVAAADPTSPVEVLEQTGHSSTVVDPAGVRTVILHTGPVRILAAGQSAPIILTLAVGPDGQARPHRVQHDLVLTPTGPTVRFADGGAGSVVWPAESPNPPELVVTLD